jgi:hypothetical protein
MWFLIVDLKARTTYNVHRIKDLFACIDLFGVFWALYYYNCHFTSEKLVKQYFSNFHVLRIIQ